LSYGRKGDCPRTGTVPRPIVFACRLKVKNPRPGTTWPC